MCGIVGIFGRNAGQQIGQLEHMLGSVRSRGEVDERFIGRNLCVATRRLKIVDRAQAAQPIFNEDRTKLIIFNGEIFNYKAIKHDLQARHVFKTDSDTETILHAYEEYGEQCVHRFEGQFAFLIYDLVAKTLFAARDHLGIVPLYFVRHEQRLYVASVIKALTFLNANIEVVPPGHSLDLAANTQEYYRPLPTPALTTRTQAVRQLRQALEDAVAKRVDTDLPVGVIYSGGIDSTIVLYEASRMHPNVTAFTIGSPSSPDVAISQRFCRERNIKQVLISLTPRDFGLAQIKQAIAVTELSEYLDLINGAISLPLFERIHQEQIKIVLSGDGSDELFGGYDMYSHISETAAADLFEHKLMTLHRTELQRVDRCSMAFEVEVRVPFLDGRVVELALAMPRDWKIHQGIEKWVVREAYKAELPSYIVNRKKHPLSYSSGLHERIRMYKILFARYYHRHKFHLHEPIRMDFSYLLTKHEHNFPRAVAEDKLARDYPRSELLKEAIKAAVRTYMLRQG